MPLIEDTLGTPPVAQPNKIKVTSPKYRGVTVDTRYVPSSSLLTHIEGSSWTVNFYSQILDGDNQLAGQNVTTNAIYQQYRLIKNLVLKVTTPLTTSQDNETKAMTMTGAANVFPCVIPNEGDMFLADIGDGREGVFRITMSEQRSIFKDTCYFIEYQWVAYSTDERRADFNVKTLVAYEFVSDFMTYGQAPLVLEEEYILIKSLQSQYYEIASQYFDMFLSNEFKTLIVPSQNVSIYDHFLTMAVKAMLNTDDSPKIRKVKTLNCDDDEVMKAPTIWDVLRTKKRSLLKVCARQVGLVTTNSFTRNPMLEGIRFTGIQYAVYPKDPNLNVDTERLSFMKVMSELVLLPSPSTITRLEDLIEDTEFEGITVIESPLIHPVQENSDYYVFSSEFYNKTSEQSRLELLVQDYLDGKALNNRLLLTLCDTHPAWGALERFYYIPIILMLIKASVRSF